MPHKIMHRHGLSLPYVLLALPFFATLLPWIYNRTEPSLFGFPFFYWYLLSWLFLAPCIMGAVVYLTRGKDDVE